jgi:protein-S-isoprenylcysteine O-methyltransferase Ste14
MGPLGYLTIVLSAAWLLSERFALTGRPSGAEAKGHDRLSLYLWLLTFICSIGCAVALKFVLEAARSSVGRIWFLDPYFGYFGCLVMVLGLATRVTAIRTLGKQFTYRVSIVSDHQVVDKGIYRLVRHPSYLGTLLCLLGLGLALENWISLLIVVVLPATAVGYRISVEEKVLLSHFGNEYEEYSRRTKRLIPGIY